MTAEAGWVLLPDHEKLMPGDQHRCGRPEACGDWRTLDPNREAARAYHAANMARDTARYGGTRTQWVQAIKQADGLMSGLADLELEIEKSLAALGLISPETPEEETIA